MYNTIRRELSCDRMETFSGKQEPPAKLCFPLVLTACMDTIVYIPIVYMKMRILGSMGVLNIVVSLVT